MRIEEIFYYSTVVIFSCFCLWLFFRTREKKSHAWRKKSANKTLAKIRAFEHQGQIFSYLRKIDPFVMEELILNTLEKRKDIDIIRNEKYTGDGGVDGRFIHIVENEKRLYLVQVKRYSKYINASDINKLDEQIKKEKAYKGLFVHTGKSGKLVYNNLALSGNINLISGNGLIKLIIDGIFER
ncbi:restriction endonuclease [Arcobacter sp. F2176]|uniref:restriction endonuclease n=1 Tax=Arcobacter sp. F2176 TaxID=2044511 RepID=UPI00100C24F9|nr:restriction endonuclease [Arcobacter sp. F2176]RXJ82158.1 restriction endonuclease [Arcobacter sp. F2176]